MLITAGRQTTRTVALEREGGGGMEKVSLFMAGRGFAQLF